MSVLAKLFQRRRDPLPALDLTHPLVIALSEELRALHALPISSKEERAQWQVAAAAFERRLRCEWAPVYDSLPHELEHYLVDVDIRAKDPGYMKYQSEQLAVLLFPR